MILSLWEKPGTVYGLRRSDQSFWHVQQKCSGEISQKAWYTWQHVECYHLISKGMKAAVSFDVSNGMKQGSVMAHQFSLLSFSLSCYTMPLASVMQVSNSNSTPVVDYSTTSNFQPRLIRTSLIRDLLFADDAALVATSFEEAQDSVDRFLKASKAFRLTFSIKKTEVVHQPSAHHQTSKRFKTTFTCPGIPHTPITINGNNLKYVKTFTYLGSTVNSNASLDDEIINRIAKATNAFGKLRHRLWDERGISLITKISVYRAVVLTSMLYRSESWTLYKMHINAHGYTLENKLSNAELLAKCKIGGIETFLLHSQLRWAGHVIRMSGNRIPKILMYSQWWKT